MSDWLNLADTVAVAIEDSDLAEDVTLTPLTGPAEPIRAIFDAAFVEQVFDTEGHVSVTASRPMCDVRLGALTFAPKEKMTIAARGRTFKISEVQKDGNGNAKLFVTEP